MRLNKTIVILLVVLVGLLGINLGQQFLANRSNDSDGYLAFWKGISAGDVQKLMVSKSGTTITVEKKGDHQWQVNDYAADGTSIEGWLNQLVLPTQVQLVAESPLQQASLGVSTMSAILTLVTTRSTKSMVLGNPTSDGGFYVKLPTGNQIYSVNGLPATLASTDLADWIDKIIARINQQSIQQISIADGADRVVIKQANNQWTNETGDAIDTTSINSMLMTLESFVTQGLISESELAALPKVPAVIVTVQSQGQNPMTFNFYETKDTAAVVVDGKPGTYTISSETLKNFEIKSSDLKPKSKST